MNETGVGSMNRPFTRPSSMKWYLSIMVIVAVGVFLYLISDFSSDYRKVHWPPDAVMKIAKKETIAAESFTEETTVQVNLTTEVVYGQTVIIVSEPPPEVMIDVISFDIHSFGERHAELEHELLNLLRNASGQSEIFFDQTAGKPFVYNT
jgi:hypothetical protein